MAHHARSAFPFNIGDSSSDTWKQFSENDTQTLIPEEEKPDVLQTIKAITADVLKNHLKLFIVICDLVVVFILTLCFLGMHTLSCEDSARQDLLEWCQPFVPVDRVIVDLSFDLLVHCDRPLACVAHAQTLAERQGFNYNFIIGDEDLVYVGKGYQCKSDALRLQMLITRSSAFIRGSIAKKLYKDKRKESRLSTPQPPSLKQNMILVINPLKK